MTALAEKEHDLLVIGGGIYGAFAAWDAVLRGLSVALVEKGDFAGGTSANNPYKAFANCSGVGSARAALPSLSTWVWVGKRVARMGFPEYM